MAYALIMFAFNALGLPINKEAGMLSIDISNSKEQVLCKSLCSDILHVCLFKGLGGSDFKTLYLNPVCNKFIEQLCRVLEKTFHNCCCVVILLEY